MIVLWLIILAGVIFALVKGVKSEMAWADWANRANRPVPRKNLLELTRAELNDRASVLGIDATRLPNKATVVQAIIKERGPGPQSEQAPLAASQRTEYEVAIEGRRPTVTRTAAGAVVAGLPGAIVGLAWRKKTRQTVRVVQRNRP